MLMRIVPIVVAVLLACPVVASEQRKDWSPPAAISKEAVLRASDRVLAKPDVPLMVKEDLFRLRVLELDWDYGAQVYEPRDSSRIPVGPDGRKIGLFLIHGGSGDHRSMDTVARLAAGKFGFKVVAMTLPGRLYMLDPSRDWPGDTVLPDGAVRTPMWNKDKPITRDQYDVVENTSMRERYGTQMLACAKPGTDFHDRMAGWPVAFEEGARDLMARHFPSAAYSIYVHGHSTGGPFSFLLTQRIPNVAGVVGMENSPFGFIFSQQVQQTWDVPFNCLVIRTWRDSARVIAWEAMEQDGQDAMLHFPMWIERVFEHWRENTHLPGFKAEYPVHLNASESLVAAAHATAKRLNLSEEERGELAFRYRSYPRPLEGPGVKPVPPALLGIAKVSTDHTLEKYQKIVLPAFAAMQPPPKVNVVQFEAGTHAYSAPEPGLPKGVAPAVVQLWFDAIMGGYYLEN
jgi:hypothetical protein